MALIMTGHHLTTAVMMKIIQNYVVTDDWQTARQLYPTFTKEVEARTNIQPVLGGNFLVQLAKLVKEGRIEVKDSVQFTKNGAPVRHPAKLYRKVQGELPKTSNPCGRCGECCKWFVLCDARALNQEGISYLYARGGKIKQGFALVPSTCHHLSEKDGIYSCDIYETRPQLCSNYIGKRCDGDIKYYVPEKCTMPL